MAWVTWRNTELISPPEDGHPSSISRGGLESNSRPSSREFNALITRPTRHTESTEHSLTFSVRTMLSYREVEASNPCTDCKSAQQSTTRGILYHSPKLHPSPCNNVGMRPRADRHTDTQTRVTTIHFASSTTHAKYNEPRLAGREPHNDVP